MHTQRENNTAVVACSVLFLLHSTAKGRGGGGGEKKTATCLSRASLDKWRTKNEKKLIKSTARSERRRRRLMNNSKPERRFHLIKAKDRALIKRNTRANRYLWSMATTDCVSCPSSLRLSTWSRSERGERETLSLSLSLSLHRGAYERLHDLRSIFTVGQEMLMLLLLLFKVGHALAFHFAHDAIFVHVGLEESRVGVVFHQLKDLSLSLLEDVRGRFVQQRLLTFLSRATVNVDWRWAVVSIVQIRRPDQRGFLPNLQRSTLERKKRERERDRPRPVRRVSWISHRRSRIECSPDWTLSSGIPWRRVNPFHRWAISRSPRPTRPPCRSPGACSSLRHRRVRIACAHWSGNSRSTDEWRRDHQFLHRSPPETRRRQKYSLFSLSLSPLGQPSSWEISVPTDNDAKRSSVESAQTLEEENNNCTSGKLNTTTTTTSGGGGEEREGNLSLSLCCVLLPMAARNLILVKYWLMLFLSVELMCETSFSWDRHVLLARRSPVQHGWATECSKRVDASFSHSRSWTLPRSWWWTSLSLAERRDEEDEEEEEEHCVSGDKLRRGERMIGNESERDSLINSNRIRERERERRRRRRRRPD